MTAEEDRARFAALRRAQALLDAAYRRADSGEPGRLAEDHLPAMSALSADLLMSGWVGGHPDGGEAAFLLLTVAHPGAPAVMPLVAAACGLDPTPDAATEQVDPAACRVEVGTDGWIRLCVGADYTTAPVGAEGAALMLTQRRTPPRRRPRTHAARHRRPGVRRPVPGPVQPRRRPGTGRVLVVLRYPTIPVSSSAHATAAHRLRPLCAAAPPTGRRPSPRSPHARPESVSAAYHPHQPR